jgi:glycerol kinase
VAFRAAEVINAMHSCVPMNNDLFIDGGMSRNPYFVQFLANMTQRVVRPASMPELTGLGTIQLAADFPGFQIQTVSQFGSVQPKPGNPTSMELFERAVSMSRQWSAPARCS